MIQARSNRPLLPVCTPSVALLLTCLSFSAAAAAPVRIETGLVQGVPADDPSVTVYKGIPFAAPPLGDLRWRPPEPAAAWQRVRKSRPVLRRVYTGPGCGHSARGPRSTCTRVNPARIAST